MNRDPVFWKNTRFVVDRFHWPNHRTCSRSYSIDQYARLDGLNSEIAEQFNSVIRRFKHTAAYMTQKHFMTLFRRFVDIYNTAKNARLAALEDAVNDIG